MSDSDAVLVPEVGMPATIHLYSDSVAAVVVKVNAKSILVARVAVDERTRRRVNDGFEPMPCWAWNGMVDRIIGEPERFALVGNRYKNGSISVTLGRSVQVRDYRD